MTDRLYPEVPNLVTHPAGYQPVNIGQVSQIAPNHTLQPYPMPVLPKNAQYDLTQLSGNISAPVLGRSEYAPVGNEKLLQDVNWTAPHSAQVSAPNPAYPPMPPIPTVAMASAMDMGGQTHTETQIEARTDVAHEASISNADNENAAQALTGLNPKSLMSSVRQHLASKPKPDSPKTIIDKVQTEIVTDPDKPRSQRSVFLTGALCGAVITYVLTSAIGNISNPIEPAKVAGAKAQIVSQDVSEAQVETLNDDVSGIEVVLPDSVDEGSSFLDEQLKPDT